MPAVHEYHLANGMTLLCFHQSHLHAVEFGLYLKGGALYENENTQGMCHLLEHLCFRGIGGLNHEDLDMLQSRMGFDLEGMTYPEGVIFRATALSRFSDDLLKLFLRFFACTPWTEEQINLEKQVVLRQIEESDCDFDEEVDRRYRRTAAGVFPTMGTAESIAALTPNLIHQWQKILFQPCNACLCITGNFSKGLEAAAIASLTDLKNNTEAAPFEQVVPLGFCMRDAHSDYIQDEEGGHAKVHLAFDISDDLVFPLVAHVLNAYTGANADSILFQTLREEEAMVAEIESYVEELGMFRRLVVRYDVRQELLVDSVRKVFSLLKRLRMYVRPVRLELTRTEFTDNHALMLDSTSSMCELMGWGWLANDLARADLDAAAKMYDDLTIEDLLDAAQSIFRPENLTISIQRDPDVTPRNLRPLLAELRGILS